MRVYFLHVNQAANSTQKKTLRRGFCHDCGFSTGFPRPHRARRTWSKPGCCQSGCLTISHNCGLHYLDSNQAQNPAFHLVSYSRRAHYFAGSPLFHVRGAPLQFLPVQSQLCAPFIDRSHAASICASLRGCWILWWPELIPASWVLLRPIM